MSSRACFPISIGRLAKGARPRARDSRAGKVKASALIAAEIAAHAESVAVGVQA